MDLSRAFIWYAPRYKWTWFGFEGSHRVSILSFVFPVFRTAMRSWRPDFSKKRPGMPKVRMFILKGLLRASVWYAHLGNRGEAGLEGWCRASQRCFFLPYMGNLFWPWDPIILFEMINLRVSMNVTCEVFVNGFRLIFLPLKTDSIWVQTLKPRVLKQFFQLSQRATILGWRPIFLDDLVKTVTNVSRNCEDYE